MLRKILATELEMRFRIKLVHVAGVQNDLADDLSRYHYPEFLRKWRP